MNVKAFGLTLIASVALVVHAAAASDSCPAGAAPQPTAEMAPALDALAKAVGGTDKAAAATQALEAAAQAASAGDSVAHAMALSLRARALSAGHSPGLQDAWAQAEAAWRALGSGPERIESLLALAAAQGAEKEADRTAAIDTAIELARNDWGHPLACATALHDGGNALNNARYTGAAVRAWTAAAEIRERCAPDSLDLAKTLNNLGSASGRLGDRNSAEAYFERALELKHRIAPGTVTEAATIRAMGRLAREYGDYDDAARNLESALAMRERAVPGDYELNTYYDDLVEINRDRGDLAEARRFAELALTGARRAKIQVPERIMNLGIICLEEGDLGQADLLLQEAQGLVEREPTSAQALADVLANRSLVSLRQGDSESARRLAERGLALERPGPGVESTALAWSNRGSACAELHDFDAAMESFQKAISIYDLVAPGSRGLVLAQIGYARVLMATGDLEGAEHVLAKAHEQQVKSGGRSTNMADILEARAKLAGMRGHVPEADADLEQGVAILRDIAPGSINEAWLLGRLGESARRQGDLDRALNLLSGAFEIERRQARGIRSDSALIQFGAARQDIAESLLAAQLTAGKPLDALTTLEESRAGALAAALAETRASSGPAGDKPHQELVSARIVFANAQKALERAVGGADSAAIVSARASYIDARDKFESLSGAVQESRAALTVIRPTDELLAMLPGDAAYVAFAVADGSLFALVVDGTVHDRRVVAVPIGRSAEDLAREGQAWSDLLLARPAARPIRDSNRLETLAKGRALFEALFPSAAREIVQRCHRLIVAPDDALWNLPFAALVTNSSGTPKFLGLEKSIVFVPSLSVLALEMKRSTDRTPATGVLVVGDPRFSRDASSTLAASSVRSERSAITADGRPPVRLASSRKEAVSIARLYDSTALLDAAATEFEVRRRISEARIVHFATHGYFNAELPMSSGLLVAIPNDAADESDTQRDGALQAWEFMTDLHLNAELAVLSACESGRGGKAPAEGVIGLTRALQIAGANGVVASYWRVDDQSAADLMIAFHRRLRSGDPVDEALRLAMNAVASKRAEVLPRDWAGFFFIGNPWASQRRF